MTEPRLHPEVFPPEQQNVLRELGPMTRKEGFYLAGGTGLAIHLGHRRSFDFDWFCEEVFDPDAMTGRLVESGLGFVVDATSRGTLHGSLEGVKVSFLAYRYPLLRPVVPWTEFRCDLASIEDIACMKLAAVAQRGARKDFIDLFAIGRSSFTLSRLVELFRSKYASRDPGHLLAALTYFDDADREPMPSMVWPDDWETMKRDIRAWVREYVG